MDAKIYSYSLDLNKDLSLYQNDDISAVIKSIEIDILVLNEESKKLFPEDFEVSVVEQDIDIKCKKGDAMYIVLPYSVMIKIGNSCLHEKVIVADWLKCSLLKKTSEDIIPEGKFSYAGEGYYDINVIHNSAFQ